MWCSLHSVYYSSCWWCKSLSPSLYSLISHLLHGLLTQTVCHVLGISKKHMIIQFKNMPAYILVVWATHLNSGTVQKESWEVSQVKMKSFLGSKAVNNTLLTHYKRQSENLLSQNWEEKLWVLWVTFKCIYSGQMLKKEPSDLQGITLQIARSAVKQSTHIWTISVLYTNNS